jgi:hypothetical protein
MSHSRSRFRPRLSALVLAVPVLLSACDSRKGGTGAGSKVAVPAVDGEANALAGLESHQDLARCRTGLQQLDAQEGAGTRPTVSEAERAELTTLLRLTPGEVAELSQATFSQTDAAYLEECLLVRSGARALRAEARPPLERARLGFDWACRMVYVDDRIPWPANPWTTLQGGSGLAASRAYVVLALWQQLGLDACLVGPPALKATPSLAVAQLGSDVMKATYAPIRACGVQIGPDLFLFDPSTGRLLTAAGGKDVLTLAAARQSPESVKGVSADEVKTWQPFLAPPLSALSRRMEWLERRNPGGAGARLYVNLGAQKAKFGPACDVWNPDADPYSAGRVLARFTSEEASTRQKGALRDHHKLLMTPIDRLPKTGLNGRALEELTGAFLSQFGTLRYTPNSPRDLLLRGQYREATSALEDVKRTVDNARTRADHDPDLQKDFDRWTVELQALLARVLRPDPGDPGGVQAQRALDAFRNNPRNRDTEQAFVLGHAARPLAAEVAFLMAQCVHERAERAQADGGTQAQGQWRNAAEWWQRFLDASAQANSPFPAREPHARDLLARCQQFAGKGP